MTRLSEPAPSYHTLNHVPIGICIIDRAHQILFWNRCLGHWTQKPAEQMIGCCLTREFQTLSGPAFRDRIAPIFEGGPPVLFSPHLHGSIIPCTLSDGTPMIQKTVVSAIPSSEPEGFHALIAIENVADLARKITEYRALRNQALNEITQRKKVEDELRISHQALKEQQDALLEKERLKVLLQLAGATAHELNQPLMILLGNLELIHLTQSLSPEIRSYLEKVEQSARRIADIVSKIQDLRQYQTKPYINDNAIIDLENSGALPKPGPGPEPPARPEPGQPGHPA